MGAGDSYLLGDLHDQEPSRAKYRLEWRLETSSKLIRRVGIDFSALVLLEGLNCIKVDDLSISDAPVTCIRHQPETLLAAVAFTQLIDSCDAGKGLTLNTSSVYPYHTCLLVSSMYSSSFPSPVRQRVNLSSSSRHRSQPHHHL